jgi:HSP20 family protein
MLITRPARPADVRSLDRIFDDLIATTIHPLRTRRLQVDLDAVWQDGNLVVTVDAPGVPKDDVSLAITERTLAVRIARRTGESVSVDERALDLGGALDITRITAEYAHGRLTIVVPPVAVATPRQIEIGVPAVEAPSQDASAADGPVSGDTGSSAT